MKFPLFILSALFLCGCIPEDRMANELQAGYFKEITIENNCSYPIKYTVKNAGNTEEYKLAFSTPLLFSDIRDRELPNNNNDKYQLRYEDDGHSGIMLDNNFSLLILKEDGTKKEYNKSNLLNETGNNIFEDDFIQSTYVTDGSASTLWVRFCPKK